MNKPRKNAHDLESAMTAIEAEAAEADRETAVYEAECKAKYEEYLATLTKDKRYYLRHKPKRDAESALRRAGAAAPLWLTKEQKEAMVAIYEMALKLWVATGVRHEVDHIVPLRGKNNRKDVVCGLHVLWNLRPIPESLNQNKDDFYYMGSPSFKFIDSSAGAASSGDDDDDIPF